MRLRPVKIRKEPSADGLATCRWDGRLGNNLFQMAATIQAAADFGLRPVFYHWSHARDFDLEYRMGDADRAGVVWLDFHEERFLHGEIPRSRNLRLHGYFQSYKYFERDLVLRKIRFRQGMIETQLRKHERAIDLGSVAVHVRRSDYLTDYPTHLTLGADYYEACFDQFGVGARFLVCSDDIGWCRENFRGDRFEFVEGQSPAEDMCLMSLCRGNVVANSTFSWWSAYLNCRPDATVVCPKDDRWFGVEHLSARDICPPEWRRV